MVNTKSAGPRASPYLTEVSYTERLEAGGRPSEVTITGTEIHSGSPCLSEGWAGRESATPPVQFQAKEILGGKV